MRRKVKQIINEGNAIIDVLQNENKSLKSNVETRKMLLNQTVTEFDKSRKKLREDIKVLENFRDVARAHLAGKTIQTNLYGEWSDITLDSLRLDADPASYRVKPEMIPVAQPNQRFIDMLYGVAKSLDEKKAEVQSLSEINHGTEANKPSGIFTFHTGGIVSESVNLELNKTDVDTAPFNPLSKLIETGKESVTDEYGMEYMYVGDWERRNRNKMIHESLDKEMEETFKKFGESGKCESFREKKDIRTALGKDNEGVLSVTTCKLDAIDEKDDLDAKRAAWERPWPENKTIKQYKKFYRLDQSVMSKQNALISDLENKILNLEGQIEALSSHKLMKIILFINILCAGLFIASFFFKP